MMSRQVGSLSEGAQWLEEFQQSFTMYFVPRHVSLLAFANEVYLRFSAKQFSFDEQRAMFFEVYLNLYILKTIGEHTPKRMLEERWMRELKIQADRSTNRVQILITKLTGKHEQWLQPHLQLWSELLRILRDLHLSSTNIYESWLSLYNGVITAIPALSSVISVEFDELNFAQPHLTPATKTKLDLLFSIHYLIKENDTLAANYFLEANQDLVTEQSEGIVTFYLSYLARMEAWGRVKHWLAMIEEPFRIHAQQMAHFILDFWLKLPHSWLDEQELESVMKRTLPWSCHAYGQFLIALNRWNDWLELYTTIQYHTPQQHMEIPDRIKEERPDLLIVIYHQELSRQLRLRNVTREDTLFFIQQLATLYNQVGQSSQWQTFLIYFKEKYKRSRALMRALQEAGY